MNEALIQGICTGVRNDISKKGDKYCILNVQLEGGSCDFFLEGHLPVYKFGTPLIISGTCRVIDHKCNGFENLKVQEVTKE